MKAFWLESATDITARTLVAQGVYYTRLDTDPAAYQAALDRVRAERGYVEQDIVVLSPDTPNLEGICAKFVDEHSHDDDEVRFVLEGSGIFDIRSQDDTWMRVEVEKGDLIIVPRDRHHRFLLTEAKHIRCVRLFRDAAGWTPQYRITAPAAVSS